VRSVRCGRLGTDARPQRLDVECLEDAGMVLLGCQMNLIVDPRAVCHGVHNHRRRGRRVLMKLLRVRPEHEHRYESDCGDAERRGDDAPDGHGNSPPDLQRSSSTTTDLAGRATSIPSWESVAPSKETGRTASGATKSLCASIAGAVRMLPETDRTPGTA